MTKMERPWASTKLRDLLHFLYRVVPLSLRLEGWFG